MLPDGCADLVFDLTDGEGSVVGTMTKAVVLPPGDAHDFFGVRFRPGRAAAFLRLPLAEITDASVPIADVWRDFGSGRVPDVAGLERELLRRIDRERDPRVDAAVQRIIDGGDRIAEIARDAGISRQHLARQFLYHVGVSPKTFARVMRFRRLVDSLSGANDWADLAARHGYYDQPHLIGEFRELAGTTPRAFRFSNP